MKFSLQKRIFPFTLSALVVCSAAIACIARTSKAQGSAAYSDTRKAICPVVYPVDQTPGERGYQYVFYGNAFFINEQGYLVTAAHVLSDVRDAGKASILVAREEAPPRVITVNVVATDRVHDVAILRAVPNPFDGRYVVSYLALDSNGPAKGEAVVGAALRPSRLKDPHSFDAPEQETDPGEVVDYLDVALDKGMPPTNIFLFHHEVLRGQSGAPVLNSKSQVVGIVEGRWLHPTAAPAGRLARGQAPPLGAAIPIQYVIGLLRDKGIVWHEPGTAQQSSPGTSSLR